MIKNDIYAKSLEKILPYLEVGNSVFLVTGASGLIGSCIVDLLMIGNKYGKQNDIYVVGRSKMKLEKRFSSFLDDSKIHIVEHDIRNQLNNTIKFDYIIHAASNADPISYAKYPVETMTTNLIGTYNVLEYGRKHPHCKIIVLSTFEVYGKLAKDEYIESDAGFIDFNLFRSCYPESKRSCEIMTRCYVDEYGVNVNVARLSSVYGPTMTCNDSKAHAQFFRNAVIGHDIVLKSRGQQIRSYTYVIDAVSGILTILFRGNIGEAYNVSNEKSIVSIADFAQIIAANAGLKVSFELPSEIESKGYSTPQNCILGNRKLVELGWCGGYTIQDGIVQCFKILKNEKIS